MDVWLIGFGITFGIFLQKLEESGKSNPLPRPAWFFVFLIGLAIIFITWPFGLGFEISRYINRKS